MKNFKITRTAVIIGWILIGITMVFLNCWIFSDNAKFFNDTVEKGYSYTYTSFGWVHIAINYLVIFADIAWFGLFVVELGAFDDDGRPFSFLYGRDGYSRHSRSSSEDEDKTSKPICWKRWVWLAIIFILVVGIFRFGKTIYKQSVFMYNTSKKYANTYQQKVQEKQGFYDKLWKTYQTKAQITKMNKDVFVEVTKIIMANVADGQKLSWKWVSRYPDIDYEQFTAFYTDLSNYIEKQREGYFNIEKVCQTIANQNNTMIDTFPNNLYNRFLKIQKINFQYGFLSDSTTNVFARRTENLK